MTQDYIDKQACPGCKKMVDGLRGNRGKDEARKPIAGDIVVCGYCATMLILEGEPDALRLDFLTPEKLDELLHSEPELYYSLLQITAHTRIINGVNPTHFVRWRPPKEPGREIYN